LIKNLLGKLIAPLAWTIFMQVLFCLPGSSLPDESSFHIPNLDKYVHVFLFATFVSLWCYYFYRRGKSPKTLKLVFFVVWLIAAFNGIIIEFIQLNFIPGRSFDKGDIIADMIGAGLAYGISNIKLLRTSI
jgi:VanZ family protein